MARTPSMPSTPRPAPGGGSTAATRRRSSRWSARRLRSSSATGVYVGFSDGIFVALNAADGGVVWGRSWPPKHDRFQDVDARAVLASGRIYAASAAGGGGHRPGRWPCARHPASPASPP
ncbi:MAG: PQQ-binding-like beta-propeller repeat protein [bacterium]